MRKTIDVQSISVEGAHIDLTWGPNSTRTRLHSYWLKLFAAKSDMHVKAAEGWTDGSNFHPEDDSIRETDRIESATVNDNEGEIKITWQDGTNRVFSLEQLWDHIFNADAAEQVPRIKWNARTEFTAFDYGQVLDSGDEKGLFHFLRSFLQYGLAFLRNVPRQEDQIKVVANRLFALQQSHLGDTFTLLPRDASHHLGETADHIPLHIDLVYKQNPPDIQMLHVLEQAEEGGENVFVDAFTIIEQMQEQDIKLLRETPVWFVADSESVHFRGLHRILAFDDRMAFRGVHFNEYKVLFPVEAPNEFFFAFKRFRQLIRRKENMKVVQLPRDSIVLFHNRRTLHGRKVFKGTSRHLTGCFISEDDLKSKFRTMARRNQAITATRD